MSRIPRPLQIILFIILLLVILVSFTILLRNAMQDNTVGMDFSTFWIAGRAVFLEHQNPYNDEIALQSQLRVLRRPSRPDEDQMGFSYPPYALLLLLPNFWMDFDYAQASWMVFNIFLLISSITLSSPKNIGRGIVSVLFLFPFTFGILLGNFVITIGAILLLTFGLFLQEQKPIGISIQIILGLLLSWITIKPQFVWLYLLFILIISWKKRYWYLLFSFAIGVAFFLLISYLMVPTWPTLWLERVQKYSIYMNTYPMTILLLKSFLPLPLSYLVAGLIFAVLLALSAIFFRNWLRKKLPLIALLIWFGFVTYLFHPRNVSYSQLAFLIPFVLWFVRSGSLKHPHVWISGLGMIVVSWLVLALTLSQPENLLLDEVRLVFFTLWMGWYYLSYLKKSSYSSLTGD